MIKFIKKTRWYAWLFLAWLVCAVIYFFQEKNYYAAFFCAAFLFMFFVFYYCMDKLEYDIDKMKNLLNERQGSEFENAVAFENIYNKHENLILENFELKSDLSKKKLEIEELENDKKSLKSLLMNVMDPNFYLITILAENKDFLKMCDDLLVEGKEKYPNDDWEKIDFKEHFKKAKGHLEKEIKGEISDHCAPHGVSALVRMIFGMINKYKK